MASTEADFDLTIIEDLCIRSGSFEGSDEIKAKCARLQHLLTQRTPVENLVTGKLVQVIEWQDFSEATALHLACASGYAEMVKILVEAGANLNAQQLDGRTPIMLAVAGTHSCHADVIAMIHELVRSTGSNILDLFITDFRKRTVSDHGILNQPLLEAQRQRRADRKDVNTHSHDSSSNSEKQFTLARAKLSELFKNIPAMNAHSNPKYLHAAVDRLDAPMSEWSARDVENWIAITVGSDQASKELKAHIVGFFRKKKYNGLALEGFSTQTEDLKQNNSFIFPEIIIDSIIEAIARRKDQEVPTKEEKERMSDALSVSLLYELIEYGRKSYDLMREMAASK